MISTEDCWLWALYQDKDGYGRWTHNGKSHLAHKAMYLKAVGDVPEGMEVDHMCDIRLCINPDHLQLLSHDRNTRKKYELNHCNKGHELTEDNVYRFIRNKRTRSVGRKCRRCTLDWHKRTKLEKVESK